MRVSFPPDARFVCLWASLLQPHSGFEQKSLWTQIEPRLHFLSFNVYKIKMSLSLPRLIVTWEYYDIIKGLAHAQ